MHSAETVHFHAFSCIMILGGMAGIGIWTRRVNAGMETSPFCWRAVVRRLRGILT
jgi:hypothetical protein